MIEVKTEPGEKLIRTDVSGRITREELKSALTEFEAFVSANKPVKALQVVHSLEGMEPSALMDDISFSVRHVKSFSRLAVATDIDWVRWWTRFAGSFIPADVRVFTLSEVDEARAWLLDG